MNEDIRIRTFGRRTDDALKKRKCVVMHLPDISAHKLEVPPAISHVFVSSILN
jgi:hypothetical protein